MLTSQDLPDELVLKILSFSETKDLIGCGQVSKRIRRISRDGTLWETVNLENKTVKTELLEMILEKGCRNLNLCHSEILGSLSSNIKSQLRVLNLSLILSSPEETLVLEELLLACCSLEHLLMENVSLTPKMADGIRKNGKTLQILNLNKCNIQILSTRKSRYLQEIFECCQKLKDINFNRVEGLSHDDLQVLAEIIPPNVEELNLGSLYFMDDHVKVLLSRCKKLEKLSLQSIWLTDESLRNISYYLNLTLEELSLLATKDTTITGLDELKSMPRLKRLNFYSYREKDREEFQKLRQHLSHLMIITPYPWERPKGTYINDVLYF